MAKKISLNRLNKILRLIIILLVLIIVVYAVKCYIDNRKMHNELAEAQQRVAQQQKDNEEVDHMLQDSEYYLEQQARGENDYADPEEDVYIIVS